jgi:hypothetical protein
MLRKYLKRSLVHILENRATVMIGFLLMAAVLYHFIRYCFLQVLFGQSCKTFLDIVACPNWTKLQRRGCPV